MKHWLNPLLKCTLSLLLIAGLTACSTTTSYTSYTSGFGTPKQVKQYKQAGNLWDDLGNHLYLPSKTASNPAVKQEIQWYLDHPGYLRAVAKKAKPYLYYIYQQVKKHDLPAEVTLMPMVESAYNPFAINTGSGASGLWQMMTGTALGFGLHVNWWYDGRRDIVASTNAALDYLTYLGNFFNNNWLLAIAAYDSGEGTIQQAVNYNASHGKATNFWNLSLSRETQIYVPKVLALATIIKHRERYPSIHLPNIPNAPYLAQVDVGSQIDLSQAAKMADLSLQKLSMLNPGYNRWATSPNGPFKLLLPVKNAARFKRQLKQLPETKRVIWYRITVTPGDTLLHLAHRYHASVTTIKEINKLHGNTIHIGQTLLIPNQKKNQVTHLVISHEKHYYKSLHNIPEPKVIHYQVKTGDSLSKIAKNFNVNQRQLIFWNGLKTRTLQKGQKLEIWPPKPKPVYRYYTTWPYHVKRGDSLIAIAKRYHVSVELLRKHNDLHGNTIRIGQVLHIPVLHQSHKRRNTSSHPQDTATRYHVRPGDTLHKIAEHYGVNIPALKQANHLTNSTIQIGQILHIPQHSAHHRPSHYTVKKGDTLSHIAHQFHISTHKLMAWNKITNPKTLHIGQVLTIR